MTAQHASVPSSQITVFQARRIITMDPGRPIAQAVAVKDGRILSVGTLASMVEPWPQGLTGGEPQVAGAQRRQRLVGALLGRSGPRQQGQEEPAGPP